MVREQEPQRARTSHDIVEINLPVRAIEFILDRVMRNLCCVGGSLRQFVRVHSFRTQEHQTIEYLSNATEAKQTTRSFAIASRSVSPNNYDRDGKNKISPASEQEGQNLLHYLCVCNSGFRLRRLPNRPCPRSGHRRHGGPSPAIASRHEGASRSL